MFEWWLECWLYAFLYVRQIEKFIMLTVYDVRNISKMNWWQKKKVAEKSTPLTRIETLFSNWHTTTETSEKNFFLKKLLCGAVFLINLVCWHDIHTEYRRFVDFSCLPICFSLTFSNFFFSSCFASFSFICFEIDKYVIVVN